MSISVACGLVEARAPGHEAAVNVLEEECHAPSLGVEVVQDIVPKPVQEPGEGPAVRGYLQSLEEGGEQLPRPPHLRRGPEEGQGLYI